MQSKSKELTVQQRRSIASRYAKGETSTQIGEFYGLSNTSILRIVREMGGEVRGRGRPKSAA